MKSIEKVNLKKNKEIFRVSSCCAILDSNFYRKFIVHSQNKNHSGAVAPSENINDNQNALMAKTGNKRLTKRVSIKAINLECIFAGKNETTFLKELNETKNKNIFGFQIVRDLILYQWKYFKKAIILKIFIPYLLYFLLFCIYTTYILERKYDEDSDEGNFRLASYVIGAVILVFNVFWAYIEIIQISISKAEYLTSFWNFLDYTSIILNCSVVIMNYSDASFQATNRVAAISVLILYFKLFYFLRIFFSTIYMVRMIIEIISDMKYFVCVLILSAAAFGNAFYILARDSPIDEDNLSGSNFIDTFIFSYKMGLGDFSTDRFEQEKGEMFWILFLLNSLIILIVLLNLLIAIMGDTFDKVQETRENLMFKELINIIHLNAFIQHPY